ncbi:helix-turn-helix domain-containing protein [Microbacterium sp.]|uniref:helix-turn-helix domain-containing protein n=1 Tax=Microbacterium sp. TaxID=51671 RepID=UPI0039E33D20
MIKIEAGVELAELMTTAQVAREYGYTRGGIVVAVRRGNLRAVGKLPAKNGAWLFARADVAAWAAQSGRHGGRTVYGAGS